MYEISDLKTFNEVRYPVVWLNTVDYDLGVELVAENSPKDEDIFYLDVFDGLVKYVDGTWKSVLMYNEEMEISTKIHHKAIAIRYVFDNGGTFFCEGSQSTIESFGPYCQVYYKNWRQEVLAGKESKMRRIVFIGKVEPDKTPPTMLNIMACVNLSVLNSDVAEDMFIRMELSHNGIIEEQNLPALSTFAAGFTEAQAIRTAIKSISENTKVTSDYVEQERRRLIGQSGILEIVRPKISITEIGGLENAKSILRSNIWMHRNPDKAKELHLTPENKILLIGVPGTGKSALCEATASGLGYDMAKFGVSKMMNKFIGQSEENMRSAFHQMNAMTPVVVWIDELGRDFSGSHTSNDGGTTDRVHGELLQGIQELHPKNLIVAAANRIDGLPPEMLRADRFDRIMFVGFPTEEERLSIIKIHLDDADNDQDVSSFAHATETFTGAEIKSCIKAVRFKIGTTLQRQPLMDEYVQYCRSYMNRVWLKHRASMVEMYRKADVEWDWASLDQHAQAKNYITGRNVVQSSTSKKEKVII